MRDPGEVVDFAHRYTDAWCSQQPEQVASFFAENGSLRINDGEPAVGRAAITEVARGFMTAYPDLRVELERVESQGDGYVYYYWSLTGTGADGVGVRMTGHERWRFGPGGLIAASQGTIDGH